MEIKLTGITKYYYVEYEEKEYTVIEMWDENSCSSEFNVMGLDSGKDVSGEIADKITEAVFQTGK